jgi:hypothetical protein
MYHNYDDIFSMTENLTQEKCHAMRHHLNFCKIINNYNLQFSLIKKSLYFYQTFPSFSLTQLCAPESHLD